MNNLEITQIPVDRCANLECPNRAKDGMFSLVTIHNVSNLPKGRNIVLLFCLPCAKAFGYELSKEGDI